MYRLAGRPSDIRTVLLNHHAYRTGLLLDTVVLRPNSHRGPTTDVRRRIVGLIQPAMDVAKTDPEPIVAQRSDTEPFALDGDHRVPVALYIDAGIGRIQAIPRQPTTDRGTAERARCRGRRKCRHDRTTCRQCPQGDGDTSPKYQDPSQTYRPEQRRPTGRIAQH